jgi:tetratricopeptide (TPR) repeat protein
MGRPCEFQGKDERLATLATHFIAADAAAASPPSPRIFSAIGALELGLEHYNRSAAAYAKVLPPARFSSPPGVTRAHAQALELAAGDLAAADGLGVALALGGRPREAAARLEGALQLAPRHSAGYALLGSTLAMKGKWRSAEIAFTRAGVHWRLPSKAVGRRRSQC